MRAKVNQNINLEDYKGIYVIGEQIEGEIHPVTIELMGEAKKLASNNNQKLTVDICGLFFGQIIVAIKFPPKAGLVCNNFPSLGSISSFVQSAVNPVPNLAASLGPKSLPIEVAPIKTISGFLSLIKFEIAIA